jgi:hypothetical protein
VSIHTFSVRRGTATYQATCSECGKTLNRTAKVEHTVNPFNRNEDGSVRSPAEVYACAQAAAKEQAEQLAGKATTCRDCQEKPVRDLLLEMFAAPDQIFPAPERLWGSPMSTLQDRKLVEMAWEPCNCGAPCCSRYRNLGGFRLTKEGKARAEKLSRKP